MPEIALERRRGPRARRLRLRIAAALVVGAGLAAGVAFLATGSPAGGAQPELHGAGADRPHATPAGKDDVRRRSEAESIVRLSRAGRPSSASARPAPARPSVPSSPATSSATGSDGARDELVAHPLPDQVGGDDPTEVSTAPPSLEQARPSSPARPAAGDADAPRAPTAADGPVEEAAAPVVSTIEEVPPAAAPVTRSTLREADRLLDGLPSQE